MTPVEALNAARIERDLIAARPCQDDQHVREFQRAQQRVVVAERAARVYLGVLEDMQRGAA